MRASPVLDSYGHWTQPCYEVKVRGTMYLWGSAGVTQNIKFDKPLHLHIWNDVFGDVITFGIQTASGSKTTMGTLQPGECISIQVQDISGVFATCAVESAVRCLIRA